MSAFPMPGVIPSFGTLVGWAVTTYYPLGWRTTANGNVYQCTTAGTSAGAGTGPAGAGGAIADGSVVWAYQCVLAPGWAVTTAYALGDVVTNGGKLYECIKAGTSAGSGGPTGTDPVINDNTVTWTYTGSAIAQQTAPTSRTGDIGAIPGTPFVSTYFNYWAAIVTTWIYYVRDLAAQAWTWSGANVWTGSATFETEIIAPGAASSSAVNDTYAGIDFDAGTIGSGCPVNYKIVQRLNAGDHTCGVYITNSPTAWAQSTAYLLGARVAANGNVYECSVAGTSSAIGTGPSGLGTGIVDGGGTLRWDYVTPAGAVVRVQGAVWILWAGVYQWLAVGPSDVITKEVFTSTGKWLRYRAPGALFHDSAWLLLESYDSANSKYNVLNSATTVNADGDVIAAQRLVSSLARSSTAPGAGQSITPGQTYLDTSSLGWARVVVNLGACTLTGGRGAGILSVTYKGVGDYEVKLVFGATNANGLVPLVTLIDSQCGQIFIDTATITQDTVRVKLFNAAGLAATDPTAATGGFLIGFFGG